MFSRTCLECVLVNFLLQWENTMIHSNFGRKDFTLADACWREPTMVRNTSNRELAGHISSASRKQTERETKNLGKVTEPYSPNTMLFPARLHMPKVHCFPKWLQSVQIHKGTFLIQTTPGTTQKTVLFKNLTDPVNQCWVYTWAKEFDNDIILLQRLNILMLSTNWTDENWRK